MFAQLSRPYKAVPATKTVSRIKQILQDINLLPDEVFSGNIYPQIHSLRIQLSEQKGGFGTNGKGRSKEYALASAYAEFLERIQNGLYANFSRTLLTELKKSHGFYYYPDEKYLQEKDVLNLPDAILDDFIRYTGKSKQTYIKSYMDCIKQNRVAGIVSLPFYDTKHGSVIHLPFNMLMATVGSNGMAAGNTPAEALFQGLCELMERWGAAEIFFKQLTPPTVPDDYLKKFPAEYKIIQFIEKSGKYKIYIKDFSASRRIPVLGLILLDTENNTYRLNVGSDTSFQVALSRCLTEVYQGIGNEEDLAKRMNPVPEVEAEHFSADSNIHLYKRYLEFGKFTMDNSGIFPLSLFADKPDYNFDPAVFNTRADYSKEVAGMIKNLHNNGYNVYIRDVSFLGFSSVLVYIPEVSALGRKWVNKSSGLNESSIARMDQIQDTFFNFQNSNSEQNIRQLADAFSKISSGYSLGDVFYITTKENSAWGQIKISFFLTQLWFRVGDFEKARDAFKIFLKQRKEIPEYYEVIDRYLELKASNQDVEEIHNKLLQMNYTKETVAKVCDDLKDPSKIFRYIKFPQCPRCCSCDLKEDCITRHKMTISHDLYEKMKERRIDQSSFSQVLAV